MLTVLAIPDTTGYSNIELHNVVMTIWRSSNFKNAKLPLLHICRGQSHPTRLLSRIVIVYIGHEGPKGSKVTFTTDFQAIFRPRFSFKKPVSPLDTERQLSGNPGLVT